MSENRKVLYDILVLAIDSLTECALAMQYVITPEGRNLYARTMRTLVELDALPSALKDDWENAKHYQAEWDHKAYPGSLQINPTELHVRRLRRAVGGF